MSNFGKIKNIWNLDVVSREEMKTILQEWDDALTKINELKTVKYDGVLQDQGGKTFENHGLDISKPIYVSFRRIRDNSGPDANAYGKNYYSFVYINYNLDTTWTVYGSDYYYRGNALIQNGDRVALAISCTGPSGNLAVEARCWNTLDKITNIILTGHPKK